VAAVKESGDEEDEDGEQEIKEDDAAAAVLGRGHRNAVLANRTRVSLLLYLVFSLLMGDDMYIKIFLCKRR